MKIVARTPTELIIRDSARMLRAFGAFLIVLGGFAIYLGATQEPDGQIAIAPIVIGALVTIGGLSLLTLIARKTFAFSKTERVFIIAKQRFGRVERQTIPLRDIADVTLEESKSDDNSGTYRVSVTLADQRRVPWTAYYTSGYAAKRDIVEIVREFIGLEASAALGSGAPTAKTEQDARRSRLGLYFAGVFCCGFLGIGVTMLAKEQRRLSVFEPVEATVLTTRVQEHSDSDGTTYEPVVVYRYRVNDRE